MTQIKLRGFKLNTIVDRLALDLLTIIQDHLMDESFDMSDANQRDALHLRILLLLSRADYVNQLLFRDYGKTEAQVWHRMPSSHSSMPQGTSRRIHDQAITYLFKVLSRALTLAQNRKDKPTNMHVLLQYLCRFGFPPFWVEAQLKRDPKIRSSEGGERSFQRTAKIFELLIQKSSRSVSAIALRRRLEYGPYWLLANESSAEVPEEISLFDVLKAMPVPIDPVFVDDDNIQKVFARILDALNERYMLLRACGLDPELWLDREGPSIAVLKDMAKLRRCTEKKQQTEQEQNSKWGVVSHFRFCFREFQGERKKFAGCKDFDEFASTEAGSIMLNQPPISLNMAAADLEGEHAGHDSAETVAGTQQDPSEELSNQIDIKAQCRYIVEKNPKLFDELMKHVFVEILGSGCSLYDPVVWNDPVFLKLLSSSPLYDNLSRDECAKKIFRKANQLVNKGLSRCESRNGLFSHEQEMQR